MELPISLTDLRATIHAHYLIQDALTHGTYDPAVPMVPQMTNQTGMLYSASTQTRVVIIA